MKKLSTYLLAAALLLAAPIFCAQWQAAGQSRVLGTVPDRREARLFDRHTVQMGETAYSIARGYGFSPRTLAEDNPEVEITRIRAGQILLIRKRERGRTEPDEVAAEWADLSGGAQRGGTTGDASDAGTNGAFDRHTVRMKETAYSIARSYGLSPQTLAEDNPGVDVTKLSVGQTLLIRRTEPAAATDGWIDLSGGAADGATAETSDNESQGGQTGGFLRREGRGMRDFSAGGTPRVAMMLPLSGGATDDFTDFCNGALVALETLKAEGRSVSLAIYDSARSADKVRSIVSSADFADTDLIIGPVLEDELESAVRFGEAAGVPVVSPLASTGRVDGPTLYQMAPEAATKYDKLRPMLEGDVNIIVVSSGAADDAEFAAEMETLLVGRAVKRFAVGHGDVVSLLDWERSNVLVVLGGTQAAVDTALKTVSSSYNHASATRSRRARISVVGSSKWASYNSTTNLTELMFKLNTHFVTNYYINRWNAPTRLFEARYLELHGDFPSRAAFRGYDAVALFVGALFCGGFTFADRLAKMSVADAFGDIGAGSVPPLGTSSGGGDSGGVRLSTDGGYGGVSGGERTGVDGGHGVLSSGVQVGVDGGRGVLSGIGGAPMGVSMPLGTPYRFVRGIGTIRFGMNGGDGTLSGGRYTNDQWTLVSLTDDFNVNTR